MSVHAALLPTCLLFLHMEQVKGSAQIQVPSAATEDQDQEDQKQGRATAQPVPRQWSWGPAVLLGMALVSPCLQHTDTVGSTCGATQCTAVVWCPQAAKLSAQGTLLCHNLQQVRPFLLPLCRALRVYSSTQVDFGVPMLGSWGSCKGKWFYPMETSGQWQALSLRDMWHPDTD